MALTVNQKVTDLTSAEVQQIQRILVRAGFQPGPIDGVWGDLTQAAYSRFLRAQGYDPRGGTVVLKLLTDLGSVDSESYWEDIVNGGELTAEQSAEQAQTLQPPPPAPPAATTTAPATTTSSDAAAAAATVPPPSDGSIEQQVRQRYPHLSYLLNNPEVRAVLLEAAQKGWTDAELQGALFPTTWWQTTQATTRLWDQKFFQDNATAMAEWDRKTLEIMNQARTAGVPMDQEGAKWVAGKVLREGWNDAQLRRFMGDLVREAGGAGYGSIREQQAQLQAVAQQFLTRLTDKDAQEYATRIMEGSMTSDAVKTMMRDQAKARFTWLAPQLDAGFTAADLFRGSQQAVADILEIDPDTIDLNNPKWSQLVSPLQEGNQLRSMNFHEAQRWARRQSEWRFTKNANDEVADKTSLILEQMGVVKL
jgi:hypothetical protein